jgi:hypothetical protein
MRRARGRRKAAQLDGPDEHLHLSRAIDLPPCHDELNSQMLVFLAVYFIAEEYAILRMVTWRRALGFEPSSSGFLQYKEAPPWTCT